MHDCLRWMWIRSEGGLASDRCFLCPFRIRVSDERQVAFKLLFEKINSDSVMVLFLDL